MALHLDPHPSFTGRTGPVLIVVADGVGVAPEGLTNAVTDAAHSGDIAKGIPGAAERDLAMSKSRKALDWEGMFAQAIDPVRARQFRSEGDGMDHEVCTMCGKFCSIHLDNLTKPETEPQPS